MNNKIIKKHIHGFKKCLAEYEQESGETITMHDFFVNVLNYSENDYLKYSKIKNKVKKKSKAHQNHIPRIPTIIEKDNPVYMKYYNMVVLFKQYMVENKDKGKTMRTFMKEQYGLEGDAAVAEMRNIENIIYKNHMSKKEKRRKRRELRKKYFEEKLGVA